MEIEYLMLHHSAVSYDKNSDQFEANNKVHEKWGMKSSLGYYLGYNYEMSKNGVIRQAREEGERTVACWQQHMNNGKCIHICLDGNFSIQYPTEKQEKSLTGFIERLRLKYPNIKIIHHRDIKSTQCPGNLLDSNWHKGNRMKLYIDNSQNQILGDEILQFGYSIPNEKKLEEITTHCAELGIELEKPEKRDMSGWYIVSGTNKKGWEQFLNI
jgi:hypothetical protein